jgi:2-aminoethylphosphonate-pyruvate transaminase
MAVALDAEAVSRRATEPACALWLAFANAELLALAEAEGATVVETSEPTPFAVFAAMDVTGVDDVRRVGVLAALPDQVVAGRKAGAGAVVAVTGAAPARDLQRAEPDAVVEPDDFAELYRGRYGRERLLRPLVLLNPGPALTTERVKRAAAGVDVCHREPEWVEVERRVRSKLRTVAGLSPEWGVALLAGSGTAALEAAVRACVRPGRRLLVVDNGVYGDRIGRIAERAGLDWRAVTGAWTQPIGVARVASTLAEQHYDAVAVVHHETTTGLLNPVAEIAAAARAAGALTLVDAVSSFGVEDLDVSALDLVACSANKCLHGLPGASFVLCSPAAIERAAAVEPSSLYLDLHLYLEAAEAGSPPFTPSVPAIAALDAALDELLVEGPRARAVDYAERAVALDAALADVGLHQLIPPGYRSRSIRSVALPAGVPFERLHEPLKEAGYVVYAGQGPLASEIFRIACMGALDPEALRAFGGELRRVLAGS